MPIYEYRCAACDHHEEFLQKVSDPVLTQCPACGQPQFKKQLSAAGFHLKGSGWYATDFKSKPAEKKADAKTETKTESKAEPKPESKPESKPEAKPDTKPKTAAATD